MVNFKPTLWKTIISLVGGFLIDIYLSSIVKIECLLAEGGSCPQSLWYEDIFNPVPLIMFVVTTVLIYLIWSFIQKKL